MKNKYLLTLSLLALLTSCNNNKTTSTSKPTSTSTNNSTSVNSNTTSTSKTSTNSTANNSTSTNSNTDTKSDTKSDSNSITPDPTPVVKALDISELQKGYAYDGTLDDDGSFDVYRVAVGDNVVTFKEYSGKNERTQGWKDTTLKIHKAYSYEPTTKENDTKTYLGYSSYDLNGEVLHSVIDVYDSTTYQSSPIEWKYAGLDNFFVDLTNADFTKNDDGTYSLDLTKDSVKELESKIKTQVFPAAKDDFAKYETMTLDSYKLTVDEDLKPTGFSCEITGAAYYWYPDTTYKFTGTFTSVGENSASKLQALQKDQDLETALNKLKAQNYKFQVSNYSHGDGCFTETVSHFSTGYVDSTTMIYTIDDTKIGYTKIDDTHYRKFDASSKKYESTTSTEGDMFAAVLSKFDFNSTIFEKISSKVGTDGVDVYTAKLNDFYSVNDSKNAFTSIFTPKYVKGSTSSIDSTLKVIVSDDEIEFSIQSDDDPSILNVRFYGFGSVETYDVSNISEPTTEAE